VEGLAQLRARRAVLVELELVRQQPLRPVESVLVQQLESLPLLPLPLLRHPVVDQLCLPTAPKQVTLRCRRPLPEAFFFCTWPIKDEAPSPFAAIADSRSCLATVRMSARTRRRVARPLGLHQHV
jgi:hypothetical protein